MRPDVFAFAERAVALDLLTLTTESTPYIEGQTPRSRGGDMLHC